LNAVTISDLEFTYERSKVKTSFELNIPSWEVVQGSFVSIVGPNGCGKSTLLRLIAGLTPVNPGTILINGKSITAIDRKDIAKQIAYVPQKNFSVFPFSVQEIVMMGRNPYLNLMGFESTKDNEIVEEALLIMQLNDIKHKGINEISGGEAQRVFIARALAQKAPIILLDEPNAHLDLEHQILIFNLMQKLNEENKITIITVSHDLNLVGVYTKTVVMMKEGRISIEGEKALILNEENIEKVFKIHSAIFTSKDSKKLNVLINPVKTAG
jgi:iron complex transport system ATP-binding protein